MSNTNYGGPAFPVQTSNPIRGHQCTPSEWAFPGMNLRDYFAGQALTRMKDGYRFFEDMAKDAYKIADAMIAERER